MVTQALVPNIYMYIFLKSRQSIFRGTLILSFGRFEPTKELLRSHLCYHRSTLVNRFLTIFTVTNFTHAVNSTFKTEVNYVLAIIASCSRRLDAQTEKKFRNCGKCETQDWIKPAVTVFHLTFNVPDALLCNQTVQIYLLTSVLHHLGQWLPTMDVRNPWRCEKHPS